MFCSYCGKSMDQDVKFCSYCGKELSSSHNDDKKPELLLQTSEAFPLSQGPAVVGKSPKPHKRMGRSLLFGVSGVLLGAIVLAAVFFFTGILSFGSAKSKDSAGDKIEGPGFDTPEEAAVAYLEALRDQNFDAMLATFAIESCVNNYDLEAMYETMGTYNPYNGMNLPTSNAYNTRLDVETRRAEIVNRIVDQYLTYIPSYANTSLSGSTSRSSDIEPDLISEMAKDTDHYVFSDLVITGTISPEDLSDNYQDEANQQYFSALVKPYGVGIKDVANVVITFEADGESYYFCPQLIRYEGKWYIQSLKGYLTVIMGLDVMSGGIVKES